MKSLLKILLFVLSSSNVACSQSTSVEKKLIGIWTLKSNYEFPDLILFRSDHKYFIYNPNNADIGSFFEANKNLKRNDIRINGSYTSMTEKGIWNYNHSTKQLILKNRNILEKWTDFSDAYGRRDEIRFYLKNITEDSMEICFKKQGTQLCDIYEKTWSYTSADGTKVSYRELSEEYTGTGNYEKEILLSGYETELKLIYDICNQDAQIIITDENENKIFFTDMTTTNGIVKKEISLKGITKLALKIKSSGADSKWKVKIEIK